MESRKWTARRAELALENCLGQVLAEAVRSPLDFPRFDNSAMDGFAVGGPGGRWKVVREIAAGSPMGDPIQSDQAVRIYTGAPIPVGTYAVIAQEDAQLDRDELSGVAREGAHIRRRGEELRVGTQVCDEGQAITPAVLAALSSLGLSRVPVMDPPKVAVLGTGDEVILPGKRLEEAQIFDSNLAAIQATLRNWGIESIPLRGHDDPEVLGQTIDSALGVNDLVISTGGVSVGARDYMLGVMLSRSFDLHFHGVAMKPGKPLAFATRSDGKAWFGLPGNPLSTWTGLFMFVAPFLGRTLRWESRPLGKDFSHKPGREEFVPFRFDGERRVMIEETVGSHANFGLLGSNGLAQIPAGSATLGPGDEVQVHVFPWEANS